MFREKAATFAMVKHGMTVIKKAIQFLNSGQIPVMEVDQPLFALAKLVQWKHPDQFGEQNFVVSFGQLHIEAALLGVIGDLLEGSGWTNVLVNAEIATTGTAASFLTGSHITRTRHAHQVTLLGLYQLRKKAFLNTNGSHDDANFQTWMKSRGIESGMFYYWNFILELQTFLLIFVRSIRTKNFDLNVAIPDKLCFLFFALDKPNYARWLPVHIQSMRTLPVSIQSEFQKGNFTVSKSVRKFSAIAIDQTHEQTNKFVKSDGGVVGITENLEDGSFQVLKWQDYFQSLKTKSLVKRLLGDLMSLTAIIMKRT
eukprot:Pompholyxophrys_punicea_v1_NODE_121_length_3355_cov_8.294759.p1 type:complete len:312 gc:universal NODE_121_length_3355_cov_8.294759:1498-2433(+)